MAAHFFQVEVIASFRRVGRAGMACAAQAQGRPRWIDIAVAARGAAAELLALLCGLAVLALSALLAAGFIVDGMTP